MGQKLQDGTFRAFLSLFSFGYFNFKSMSVKFLWLNFDLGPGNPLQNNVWDFFKVKKSWFWGKNPSNMAFLDLQILQKCFCWWCFLRTQHKWSHIQLTEMELELKWIHTTTFYNLKINTGIFFWVKNGFPRSTILV